MTIKSLIDFNKKHKLKTLGQTERREEQKHISNTFDICVCSVCPPKDVELDKYLNEIICAVYVCLQPVRSSFSFIQRKRLKVGISTLMLR